MKAKITSPVGLNAAGVGPKIFKWVTLIIIFGILTRIFFPSASTFPSDFLQPLAIAGWFWMTIGIIFWICGVVQFLVGFPKGKLITNGVFSVSRNPIYSAWIIFVLPGLAVICNNWIFLLSAVVMYILLKINIKEEEQNLTVIFGEQYIEYANRVNRLWSFPPFYYL